MDVEITRITCARCKIAFWILKSHKERLLITKEDFFCPNGHCQRYTGETDTEKLKRIARRFRTAQNERDELARSRAALRGVITKMRGKDAKKTHRT